MGEERETETKRDLAVLGAVALIVGWYVAFSDIDLAFVRKSDVVSQPFFLLEIVIIFVLLMTGIWCVTASTRYLSTMVAGDDKEGIAAERERVKDMLKNITVCFAVFSLIMVSLSLIFPSWFLLFLSAFLIIVLVGVISSLAVLLTVMKD